MPIRHRLPPKIDKVKEQKASKADYRELHRRGVYLLVTPEVEPHQAYLG